MAFLLLKDPRCQGGASINRFHLEMGRRSKVAADSLAPVCEGGGRTEAMTTA